MDFSSPSETGCRLNIVQPTEAQWPIDLSFTLSGRESYLMVDLEPGRYAWISEMHGIDGFVHEFTVE